MNDPWSHSRRTFLAAAATAAVAGCLGDDDEPTPTPTPPPAPDDWIDYRELETPAVDIDVPEDPPTTDVSVETLVTDLEIPWDLDFDTDGNLYMTERTGQILAFDGDDLEALAEPTDLIDTEAAEDGWWVEGGEGGTLGIATAPDTEYLYVYYTAHGSAEENRVVRYDRSAEDPAETETIVVDGIPAANVHNGGRITFGPDGYLWITTGDAEDEATVRQLDSLAGKILRVDADGEAAPDNPDLGGDDRIYCGGLRNVQGIDWLGDDLAVMTEHGPHARDEIHVVYPGGDYGWDAVRGEAGDDDYGHYEDHPSVVPPLVHTGVAETWAPSGSVFYTGDDVPSWQHRYLVGGLNPQRLYILTFAEPGGSLPDGGTVYDDEYLDDIFDVTVHEVLTDEIGRIRHIEQGPNGELYAITSNMDGRAGDGFPQDGDDRLVRIQAD